MERRALFGGIEPESRLALTLYKFSQLFLLNLLWIVFSIPIVTAGASTAALYTVTLKMVKDKESYIARAFFKAFRRNLKQGTIIGFLYALTGSILYFNMYVTVAGILPGQVFFQTLFTIMAVVYAFIGLYLFPVLAWFDTSVRQIVKMAAFLSFRHLGYTLAILIIILVPFLLVGLCLYLIPVLLIIAVSGPAYGASYFFEKIFSRYAFSL